MGQTSRYRVPVAAAVALIVAGIGVSIVFGREARESARPNVVVIMVDTLRPEFTGAYGHEPDTTPFLTQIAARATVFENAFSTSTWTAPSVASLFTSLYPHQHGVTQGFYAHEGVRFEAEVEGEAEIPLNAIAEELTTLPELFREAGYATFGAAANRNVDEEMGFRSGFDRFFQENDRQAEGMYDVVRGWRGEMERGKPYFLYLHLMDPHAPYREHTPYFTRYDDEFDAERARYLAEIRYTDRWIERIFKLLRLDRNTLVVFVADHGEEFMDHGHIQHGPFLYDELKRVMLMVYGPELGVPAQRRDMNVSLIDVVPTLAEFLGVAAPEAAAGASLWPMVMETDEAREFWDTRVLLGHRAMPVPPYEANWSAMRGTWKYIEHVGLVPELFDHATDPRERTNVAGRHPEIAAELAAAVTTARGAPREFGGKTLQVPVDQELIEELRSLGYTN